MLYWIYEIWMKAEAAGEGWAETFSFLRLFKYLSVRGGLAALMTFGLTLTFGPRIIRKLISLKVGQPIRTADEVHKLAELHGAKAGTPTMGGGDDFGFGADRSAGLWESAQSLRDGDDVRDACPGLARVC